ncbi:MAG: glycosyltransferase family 2 protein, partial [Victivallales bacterium]|nr:glycosyltransferase family 2 protein [Victivallales bacterium]
TPENLGYARGNNLGVKFLLDIDAVTDKMLFSNDDIEFLSDNVVDVLAERLDSMPGIGCIGPMVVDLNGGLQGPGYRRPRIGYTIRRNFGEPLLGAARYSLDRERERVSEKVNIVGGCFHMVRTSDFLEAGLFDERTFLYWEEEIFSERLNTIGKAVYYEASVKILHYVGNTTSKHAPNLLLLKCELDGQRIYYRNYAKAGLVARGMLRISAWFRLLIVRLCILRRKIIGKH